MRTIKFRGRSIDNEEWVVGYFVGTTDNVAIIIPFDKVNYDVGYIGDSECCYCFPETIGQFTGLYDKNGNEIYEGDILQEIGSGKTVLVVYEAPQFCYADNSFGYKFLNLPENYTVIANIHDNPELLKGDKE